MMPDAPQPQRRDGLAAVPLLVLVWEWRWVLVGCVAAGVVVGLVIAMTSPVLYGATETVLVTSADATPETDAVALGTARTLMENRSVAAAVIARFGLDKTPESLTPDRLVRDRLTIAQVRNTNYLRVTLRLRSRDIVSDVLQQLVLAAVKLNDKLAAQEDRSAAATVLGQQLQKARDELSAARDRLLAGQRSVRLEQVRTDVDLSLSNRTRAGELAAQIAAERARLARTEQQLANRPRGAASRNVEQDERSLLEHSRQVTEAERDEQVQWPETATPPIEPRRHDVRAGDNRGPAREASSPPRQVRSASRPDSSVPLPLTGRSDDPVYDVLDYQAATGRAKLAALEAQRATVLKDADPDLQRMYAAEMEIAQLEVDYDLALAAYKRLVERYNAARELTITRSPQIQIVDSPVVLARRASPNVFLNAALGGLVGLLCAAGIVFLRWRALPAPPVGG